MTSDIVDPFTEDIAHAATTRTKISAPLMKAVIQWNYASGRSKNNSNKWTTIRRWVSEVDFSCHKKELLLEQFKRHSSANRRMGGFKKPGVKDSKAEEARNNYLTTDFRYSLPVVDADAKIQRFQMLENTAFPEWTRLLLAEGCSILLGGSGSKKILVDKFVREHISPNGIDVFVMYGYHRGLDYRTIMAQFCNLIEPNSGVTRFTSPTKLVAALGSALRQHETSRYCLTVHSMDDQLLDPLVRHMILPLVTEHPNLLLIGTLDDIRWESQLEFWDIGCISSKKIRVISNVDTLMDFREEHYASYFEVTEKDVSGAQQKLNFNALHPLSTNAFSHALYKLMIADAKETHYSSDSEMYGDENEDPDEIGIGTSSSSSASASEITEDGETIRRKGSKIPSDETGSSGSSTSESNDEPPSDEEQSKAVSAKEIVSDLPFNNPYGWKGALLSVYTALGLKARETVEWWHNAGNLNDVTRWKKTTQGLRLLESKAKNLENGYIYLDLRHSCQGEASNCIDVLKSGLDNRVYSYNRQGRRTEFQFTKEDVGNLAKLAADIEKRAIKHCEGTGRRR